MNIITNTHTNCQQNLISSFSLTKFQIEIIGLFVDLDSKYKEINISQGRIAFFLNSSLRSINRHIGILSKMGILSKKKRYNTTSIYKVSQSFKSYVKSIKPKFKSPMFVMAISSLMSFIQAPIAALNQVFKTFGVSIKYNRYIFPVYTFTRERYIPQETYIPQDGVVLYKTYKKEVNMKEFEPCAELRILTKKHNLTKWGQLKLSIFSGVVLSQVDKSLDKLSKKPDKQFEWIFLAAKTISETNGMPLDWQSFYDYKEYYKMPDNAQMIFPKTIKPTIIVDDSERYLNRREKDIVESQSRIERNASDPVKSAMQKMFESMLNQSCR